MGANLSRTAGCRLLCFLDMSLAIAAYCHDAFIGLPSVMDAGSDLQTKGGRDVIHDVLGPLFTKHGVEEKFGLGLLHRHFEMAPSERLVELNNISTPWNATDAQSIGGILRAQSWLFADNQLVPYEFRYVHGEAAHTQLRSQDTTLGLLGGFLKELYAALLALDLDKTLGLRLHPGMEFDGLVEVTAGRANINFHPSEMSPKNSTDTAWFFDEEYIKRGCKCKCNEVATVSPPRSRLQVRLFLRISPPVMVSLSVIVQNSAGVSEWSDNCIIAPDVPYVCNVYFRDKHRWTGVS